MKLINIILDEFKERQDKNSSYSFRAFSRDLDISHGHLIQVLSGKKPFSLSITNKIIEKLDVEYELKEAILKDIRAEADLKDQLKTLFSSRLNNEFKSIPIGADEYIDVSHWTFDAIFHLLEDGDIQTQVEKISTKLSFEEYEVENKLKTLERLRLLEIKGQKIIKNCHSYYMNGGKAEMSMQKLVKSFAVSQREMFDIAINCFVDDKNSANLLTTQAYYLSDSQIELIKKAILQFSDTLELIKNSSQENSTDDGDVYFFNTQFFPVK